ncbi:MAG: substrate-binding domain-containing protein [Ktedonobacteraceae bacterium]
MKLFHFKKLSGIFGLILICALLAACGSANSGSSSSSGSSNSGSTANATPGKGCKKVGILLPESASSDRWENKDKPLLEQAIKAALPADAPAADYNNAQGDDTTQINQANTDLTKGDCILVVAAHDGKVAASIVAKAKASNVPVIAYDRLIQSKDLGYYVSFDNVKVGELQGQYIVDHHKKGDNVVMINGSQTDNNAILFRQGALSKLQPLFDSGELHKVYDQYTPNWDNDKARVEMDGALTAQKNNVQVAYVANDGMANSVIASLKAQKLAGQIPVTGQDATVAGLQNILAGSQSMTVYKAIPKEASAVGDLVKAIYNGTATDSLTNGATTKTEDGGAIPSILETPVSVDKANIASTVIADGYVTKDQICKGLPAGAAGVC